jgi:hypothetical protein
VSRLAKALQPFDADQFQARISVHLIGLQSAAYLVAKWPETPVVKNCCLCRQFMSFPGVCQFFFYRPATSSGLADKNCNDTEPGFAKRRHSNRSFRLSQSLKKIAPVVPYVSRFRCIAHAKHQ